MSGTILILVGVANSGKTRTLWDLCFKRSSLTYVALKIGKDVLSRTTNTLKKALPKRASIKIKPFVLDFLVLKAEWERETGQKVDPEALEEWRMVEMGHYLNGVREESERQERLKRLQGKRMRNRLPKEFRHRVAFIITTTWARDRENVRDS